MKPLDCEFRQSSDVPSFYNTKTREMRKRKGVILIMDPGLLLTLDFPARTATEPTFVVANSLKTQLFPECCHHPRTRLAFFQNQKWRTNKRSYQTHHFFNSFPTLTSPRNPLVRATATATTATNMVKAIRVHELGGPEVLKWEDVEIGEPGEGEIRIKNKAIGLNFIDVYFRKGVYTASEMPFIPGMEAVGEVIAIGPGLTGRKIGDIVAYAGNPMGSYAEEQILPANKVVSVPESISPVIAASVMLKGMTTQFLLRRCFKVEPGHTILVHAAAGGVGSLLCQWANALGATVIGTVSTREKAAQAKEDGCQHIILYQEEDFVARVNEITSCKGVDVVYDSVGKDTFQGSLACLKTRGYMVSFGQSSGAPDPVPLSALAPKSLFLTRPSMLHYNQTRDELLGAAGELFAILASGVLRVRVNHTYPLSQAAQAHADLESRKTTGSVVLIP